MSNNQDGQKDLKTSSTQQDDVIDEHPIKIKISENKTNFVKLTLPEKQERTRSWLAWFLSGTFCITIFSGLFIIYRVTLSEVEFNEDKLDNVNQSILSLLSVQTGIVGSAQGFYFGTRNKD